MNTIKANLQEVYQTGFEAGVKFASFTAEKTAAPLDSSEDKRQERLRKARISSRRYYAMKKVERDAAKVRVSLLQ